MKPDIAKKDLPYSFGEIPSDMIRRVDHRSWWDIFMKLVGSQPESPEQIRLSDDPVHIIHGQNFSIRDCAAKAIDAAYAAGEDLTAESYTERANKLIHSYDRLVTARVRRFYDTRFQRSLLASGGCLLLSAVVTALYVTAEQPSIGLIIILLILVITALGSALFAAFALRTKRRILRLDQKAAEKGKV